MKRKAIFNSRISTGSRAEFIQNVFSLVRFKVPSYICFANVHMLMEAHRNPAFQDVINNADIVAPDGKPISVFLGLFHKVKQERVCGMDMLPGLLGMAEQSGKSVYFYGTTDEVLKAIVQKASHEFPSLRIAGYCAPPFRSLSDSEKGRIVREIRQCSPDLVFVSLGCPKQEKWMAEHKDLLRTCLLGVGQAFRTYAGLEKRLPEWMRNLSMEWMYRLCQEPGRLWKRYLFTNTHFVLLVAGHSLRRLASEICAPFVRAKMSRRFIEKSEE